MLLKYVYTLRIPFLMLGKHFLVYGYHFYVTNYFSYSWIPFYVTNPFFKFMKSKLEQETYAYARFSFIFFLCYGNLFLLYEYLFYVIIVMKTFMITLFNAMKTFFYFTDTFFMLRIGFFIDEYPFLCYLNYENTFFLCY